MSQINLGPRKSATRSRHRHGHGRKVEIRVLKNPWLKRSRSASMGGRSVTAKSATQSKVEEEHQCLMCQKMTDLRNKSGHLKQPTANSDLLVRAADGTTFHCHSFVLDAWCPSLLTNLAEGQVELDLPFMSDIVDACLQLMYGGNLQQVQPQLLDEIMKMADTYQMPDLKVACLLGIATADLTPANACIVWYYASLHKIEHLQHRAMQYVLDNVEIIAEKVRGRPAWYETVRKPEMLSELFFGISDCTRPKPTPSPTRDTRVDKLWDKSNGLRQPYAFSDMAVVTKDKQTFHVHLPLLALAAHDFAKAMHEAGTGCVSMPEVDGEVAQDFLRAIYGQPPSPVFPTVVDLVYVLAREFNAESVANVCEQEMVKRHSKTVEGLVGQLKEAEEHRMPTAKAACIRHLFDLGRRMAGDESWKDLVQQCPMLVAEMIVDWKKYRQKM